MDNDNTRSFLQSMLEQVKAINNEVNQVWYKGRAGGYIVHSHPLPAPSHNIFESFFFSPAYIVAPGGRKMLTQKNAILRNLSSF